MLKRSKKIIIILFGVVVFALTILVFSYSVLLNGSFFGRLGFSRGTPTPQNFSPGSEEFFLEIDNHFLSGASSNLSSRSAHLFFPLFLNDLSLVSEEVYTAYVGDFLPVSSVVLTGTEGTIPVDIAYYGYYVINRETLSNQDSNQEGIIVPLKIESYDISRPLTDKERSIFFSKMIPGCSNEEAKVREKYYIGENLVVKYCGLNLTEEQSNSLAENKTVYDDLFSFYFVNRNLLVEVSIQSKYLEESMAYVESYLTKLVGANDQEFVKPNKIVSVEEQKEFERWRQETFN